MTVRSYAHMNLGLRGIAETMQKTVAKEIVRCREMLAQGYGQRQFSSAFLRTDEAPFDETGRRLKSLIQTVLAVS
jgi:hypothetical protein